MGLAVTVLADALGQLEAQRVPEMAHGLEDGIVELNWARDE
jgi:hypothetical protein